MKLKKLALATLLAASASTQAATSEDTKMLLEEIRKMKTQYEQKIESLENRIHQLEGQQKVTEQKIAENTSTEKPDNAGAGERKRTGDNAFNPAIGVILNGKYQSFSERDNEIAGFAVGEEGERGKEGLAIDESELNMTANIDDKFYGSLTAAIVREEGEDKLELEEAYLQTLTLPYGLNLKAGRFFSSIGYLNERHTHSDDFADRPLPYRAYLNNSYNDDGAELSWLLPTPFYSEVGAGWFRGDDYPAGGAEGEHTNAKTVYARVGNDIGDSHSWRLGLSWLRADIDSDDIEEEETGARTTGEEDDTVKFEGDSKLLIADLKYTWSPQGNNRNREFIVQGEYFKRDEDGRYKVGDDPTAQYDEDTKGWYAQTVYKFHPQWRVGYRYATLDGATPDNAALLGTPLDPDGHTPKVHTLMTDWTNSEFSRWRLQYSDDKANRDTDRQWTLQYIMSLGAHGAHKF